MSACDETREPASPRRWKLRRLTFQGLLVTVGYILSPLSWWNDAFVNLPLAYGFGVLVNLFFPGHFVAAVMSGYWLTNILGLFLIHRGVVQLACKAPPCRYDRKMLAKDLAISALYTAAVGALAWLGILAPPAELLKLRR